MWATRLISDGGLQRTDSGFSLDIRLPWYRTLPVATLRDYKLTVDGQDIPSADMELDLNGKTYAFGETDAEPANILWHVQDSGVLKVRQRPLAKGRHEVTLQLTVAIPYGRNFVLTTECSKSLAA